MKWTLGINLDAIKAYARQPNTYRNLTEQQVLDKAWAAMSLTHLAIEESPTQTHLDVPKLTLNYDDFIKFISYDYFTHTLPFTINYYSIIDDVMYQIKQRALVLGVTLDYDSLSFADLICYTHHRVVMLRYKSETYILRAMRIRIALTALPGVQVFHNLGYEFIFSVKRYKRFISNIIYNYFNYPNIASMLRYTLDSPFDLGEAIWTFVMKQFAFFNKTVTFFFKYKFFDILFTKYDSNVEPFLVSIINIFSSFLGYSYNRTAAIYAVHLYRFDFVDDAELIGKFNIVDFIIAYLVTLRTYRQNKTIPTVKTLAIFTFYHEHRSLSYFESLYILLGSLAYLMGGGESNPGPVVQWIKDYIRITLRSMVSNSLSETVDLFSTLSDLGIMSVYLMRLFSSFSDLLSSCLFKASSTIELTTRLTTLILNIYETYQKYGAKMRVSARAQVGPYETVLATALLSSTMPDFIRKIIKDMPVFSHTKLLDDFSLFNDIFGFLISIPRRILGLFDFEGSATFKGLDDILFRMECIFPFSHLGALKSKMEKVMSDLKEKPALILEENFQKFFMSLEKERKDAHEECMRRRGSLPNYIKNIDVLWKSYHVQVANMLDNVRIEPLFCLFKGPPGTGKTTLLNSIMTTYIQSGNSVYYDRIPAALESRHFFDGYNNQDLYVIDDIGARANAQWSEIINMVSTAKYALDAAAIDQKNLKYFNSKLMLTSCNILPLAFGAKDGVSDAEALFRRIEMFNFNDVVFDRTTGKHKGILKLERYDDTLGVKKFTVRKTFNLDDPSGMQAIVDHIDEQLEHKFYIHTANKNQNGGTLKAKIMPHARPQAKSLSDYIDSLQEYMPDIFNTGLDITIQSITYVLDLVGVNSGDIASNNLAIICVFMLVIMVGLILHYLVKYLRSDGEEAKKLVLTNRHYNSQKITKKSLNTVMRQGLTIEDGLEHLLTPQMIPLSKNMCELTFQYLIDGQGKTLSVKGVISGNRLLTVAHVFDDVTSGFVTVKKNGIVIYECVPFEISFTNHKEDIAFLQLGGLLPRLAAKIKLPTTTSNTNLFLLTTPKIIHLNKELTSLDFKITYKYGTKTYELNEHDLCYPPQADGMCGSLLINEEGFVFGMHVAAIDHENGTNGVAKMWTDKTIIMVSNFLEKAELPNVPVIEQHDVDGQSGSYLEPVQCMSAPTTTNYVHSLVNGIFPPLRKPALEIEKDRKNLSKIITQYLEPSPLANIALVDVAADTLDTLLDHSNPYPNLTEQEIVLGGDGMSRINPKTSSGYIYGDKRIYLNFEEGFITPAGKQIVRDLVDKMKDKDYAYEDYATLTPKDEIKDIRDKTDQTSQPEKIRVFTNYHLVQTILFRFFLGNFLSDISSRRHQTGIMVGINPFSEEWGKLADNVSTFGRKVFDGDYKHFDRHMHPLFQRALHTLIRKRVNFSCKNFNAIFHTHLSQIELEHTFDILMETIISTPIVTSGKRIMTTHGLPSGTAVTAIYNSFINKMYTYYAFYALVPTRFKNKTSCLNYMYSAVYGDDVLGSVKEELREYFNPRAFSECMQTIGLDFTPADKGAWTESNMLRDVNEVSFLKREFYFHPSLKRMVAPLSTVSMESTLNYVTDKHNNLSLTIDKLLNYQREAYLHGPEYYTNKMRYVKQFCEEREVKITFLPENDLIKLYNTGDYSLSFAENYYY